MSSQSRTRLIGAIVLLAPAFGGCSDIYWDRRETIALGANDAVETDKVTQMIDPWPRYVADRQIAFNGQRMQAAQDRYRHNRVIPPVNATTSSTAYQRTQTDTAPAPGAPDGGSLAPAAAVRSQ
jgi:hypothetical protein